ncbi:MAG: 50S ribosomal protein L30 [Armatimonadetes bacterium]|nr:50S ribosomal protein L30 [Armatimonadota bacterium]NIO75183.1 50S ribosomal protein L30 [Armatimonadota bacterium]NIO95802.1 50S ribosomal protein L30 [Armatimonadota bacterium]
MSSKESKKVKITLRRSLSGRPRDQRDTVHALGLKKISQSRLHPDNPQIRGMARKIAHLVEVEETT